MEKIPASYEDQTHIDLAFGTLIHGADQLDRYAILTDQPEQIHPLIDALRDDIPLDAANSPTWNESRRGITKDDCLKYGEWLITAINNGPTHPKQKSINSKLLSRAWRLGLGPGPWTIRDRFGSLGEFYSELKLEDSHRIGLFDDWTIDRYVSYFKDLGVQKGTRPTIKDLKEQYKADPFNNPSPVTFYKRFKDIGGLNKIADLAGYEVVDLWDDDDFVNWGVRFMKANNGLPPTARTINHLSKSGNGPSSYPLGMRFGSIPNYRKLITEEYRQELRTEHEERARKLEDIAVGTNSGRFPADLFSDSNDDDEKIRVYAKFIVMDELFPGTNTVSKISISTGRIEAAKKDSFERLIRKINNAISNGDIESTALYLGVFDDIWPPDQTYLERLRLPNQLSTPLKPNQFFNEIQPVKV